jgi:predicted neuraminidase
MLEFIYETAPFPSCHASTLEEVAPGEIVAAWFGGTDEGEPDVGIWLARRIAAGWSAPVRVAAEPAVPCWNPVLHRMRASKHRGELLLFYKAGPSPERWSGFLIRSRDGGRSWSKPELLPAGILGPIKNKPLEIKDGVLLCGSSVESYHAWSCWVERTPDAGRSWSKHGPITVKDHPHGIIQPALFEIGHGRIAMLCRTRGMAKMVRAVSDDRGHTWTDALPIDLPQNNSGLDAVRLHDGRVVLIYNHTTRGRTPLNLAVSEDGGLTWKPGPVLETEPGEFSYPAIIQAADGAIHFTYTWNRKRIRYGSIPHAAIASK